MLWLCFLDGWELTVLAPPTCDGIADERTFVLETVLPECCTGIGDVFIGGSTERSVGNTVMVGDYLRNDTGNYQTF